MRPPDVHRIGTSAGCGHGDVLDDRPRRVARRLCGGGPDPDGARADVTTLLRRWLAGQQV